MASSSSSPAQQPISIHIPPTLKEYATPAAKYLSREAGADGVAVGAFIFAYSRCEPAVPRLLLLKRAKYDGRYGDRWEVPGGGCDDGDPTMLHSLARETFEESGLHLTSVVQKVGETQRFTTGRGLRVLKLSFEIEVQEISGPVDLEQVPVELAPDEHQDYAWASEEEVASYAITTEQQKQCILDAFRRHRQRRDVEKAVQSPLDWHGSTEAVLGSSGGGG